MTITGVRRAGGAVAQAQDTPYSLLAGPRLDACMYGSDKQEAQIGATTITERLCACYATGNQTRTLALGKLCRTNDNAPKRKLNVSMLLEGPFNQPGCSTSHNGRDAPRLLPASNSPRRVVAHVTISPYLLSASVFPGTRTPPYVCTYTLCTISNERRRRQKLDTVQRRSLVLGIRCC